MAAADEQKLQPKKIPKGGIPITKNYLQKGLAVLIACIAAFWILLSICYNAGVIQEMLMTMEIGKNIGSAEADKIALILTTFLMVFSCIALSLSTIFISEAIKKEKMIQTMQEELKAKETEAQKAKQYAKPIDPIRPRSRKPIEPKTTSENKEIKARITKGPKNPLSPETIDSLDPILREIDEIFERLTPNKNSSNQIFSNSANTISTNPIKENCSAAPYSQTN